MPLPGTISNMSDQQALHISHTCRSSWVQSYTCVLSVHMLCLISTRQNEVSSPVQKMLLPFHCFLTGFLKRCCLLGDMYKWRCCLLGDIHKWRCMSQQRPSVLSQHHLKGSCLSVCTGRMAPWLASGERLEQSGESWWRDHLLWKGGWAGPRHRGCTGGEAGRGKPLSVAALKWEGGLWWADFSCEEQKARLSLHQLSTFSSTDETVRSPAEALRNYPWQPIDQLALSSRYTG